MLFDQIARERSGAKNRKGSVRDGAQQQVHLLGMSDGMVSGHLRVEFPDKTI